VSPAKFVPLAEEANLIVPIGLWALRQACIDAANWPRELRVAVNVSADQLTSKQFTATVVEALRDSQLAPQRLEIEITESVFLRDGGFASQMLDQLIALGVKLSLDDFGTGYSSLGYLRKTRFDTIKIDKSFVQGAAKNVPESVAIIRAVVAMAESLGMATTAEGVETDQELELVRKLGCTKIQGYLFGRPMPLAETMRILQPDVEAKEEEIYRRAAARD
jgi:EAL domain-containing protein (putative c-di-GMP-specific phosphodiesterase class I)